MSRLVRYLSCLATLLPLFALAQPNDSLSTDPQKVYKLFLVAVDCKNPDSVEKAYSTRFDTKKVEMKYIFEDSINNLEDISFGEDPLEGPDCFIPEMKIIFYRATYIISFYCSEVRKYKNSAPWTTSSVRIKNDLPFTQSVYDYLLALRNRQLGNTKVSETLIAKLAKPEALDDPADDIKELEQALNQEDADKDKDDEDEVAKDNNFSKTLEGEDEIAPTDKPDDDDLETKDEDDDSQGVAPSSAPKQGAAASPPAGQKPAETKPATPTPADNKPAAPTTPAPTKPATPAPTPAPKPKQ